MKPFRIAIIGAGFSGVCMAIKLKAAGYLDFVVFERAAEIGGTWRDNTYPGCACDVPSHLYSYSFDLNPDWSRGFAPWHEIAAYLQRCVARYGIGPHIRFKSDVRELRFDTAAQVWELTIGDGTVERFNAVVSGTGPLNKPDLPKIPGIETFRGAAFHSSHWDHEVVLDDKRVAVIGTGASAIQIVPNIAERTRQLHLFQRTPPWVLPRLDRAYHAWEKTLFRWLKPWNWVHRKLLYFRLEHFGVAVLNDGRTRRFFEGLGRWYIKKQIHDPALREKVTPRYRIGCKRALISDDYYPSLNRSNVELVTDEIVGIRPTGVVTRDGRE
ncbi:MAG: flavin-containing monooxygenase, partial [Gammaproteobacteria bacterium]